MSCVTHLNFEVKNMSSTYLKVTFFEAGGEFEVCDEWKYRVVSFAVSEIYHKGVKSARKLAEGSKTVYKLGLDLEGVGVDFMPGDTIGVLPRNDESLVEKIFIRLGVEAQADQPCELGVSPNSGKKNAVVPKHLPVRSTLRTIFLNHVDLHTPPKKLFLKSLLGFATGSDASRLTSLSSPQSPDYSDFIASNPSLLNVLETFPSLTPPISLLLEHLPPLQPRPYSICSSPLSHTLEITFDVTGLCTKFMEKQISSKNQIAFYFRKPGLFRLPNLANPVIMIATGTGIAPFRGFLQHWKLANEFGDVWLFYGCRFRDRDFLFKDEINELMCEGIVNRLNVAFSRESDSKKYIQSEIDKRGADFVDWVNRGARIYVCGDFRTVVKDVRTCVAKNLVKYGGLDEEKAEDFVKGDRFIVDTWN
ncbi:Nitric oxide synthase-like Protein [Tribolium castaneum]|uniref:NADPH--hemoprotein reductase n=1 Tax=Tribolium castaneum TaxID=7070 RepID=D7EIT2_TRICA|nr:PREDICTED: methionine synthase reductase [Tribolium castaneum]EFA12372.2 Nitric oxide synthase-like Protein [Tribolium castaneum]|eukprot:XP_966846.2 PREDICTED: methionine synthase reductase [Tribolium castaneum]